MQTLRNAHLIARFVLLWFALSVGVAIASPLVKPQSVRMVCSASGASKVIVGDADDQSGSLLRAIHCPLCVGVGAPPPLEIVAFSLAPPLGYAPPLQNPVRIAPVATAPPPARGPPSFV
jgi:hypothetical protein